MQAMSNFCRFIGGNKVSEPSLLDLLPTEIMQIIIRQFLPDEKDRGNLALTSRALNAQVNKAREDDYLSVTAFIMPREAIIATGEEVKEILLGKVKKGDILFSLGVMENKVITRKLVSARIIQGLEDGSRIVISTLEGRRVLILSQENCPNHEYKTVKNAYNRCLCSAWRSTETLPFFSKFYRRGLIAKAARQS